MFGFRRKFVSIAMFKRGGDASVVSCCNGRYTKREVLKKVSEWWDNHGTCCNDYDGIQIVFSPERKEKAQLT